MTYGEHMNTRETPANQPVKGKGQVKNRGGGYSFEIDKWQQLRRFLILGAPGGTYYATEREMATENYDCLLACLEEDYKRAIDEIVSVSHLGQAPRQDPAIFLLAVASAYGIGTNTAGSIRNYALAQLSKVCRIPTHLFKFLNEVKNFRGRGRALKRAVQNWYLDIPVEREAFHMIKYQSREKWDHQNVLNLFRPNLYKAAGEGTVVNTLEGKRGTRLRHQFADEQAQKRWQLHEWLINQGEAPAIPIVEGFLKAKETTDPKETAKLIREYGLTREMVRNETLKSIEVWDALLEKMPITALIRNLANMTRSGLLKPMSSAAADVVQKVTNEEVLKKGRVHPITILAALKTYSGGGQFGRSQGVNYTPVQEVVDALDEAFYLAFGAIKPAGKRTILGIDVSGSMMGWYGYGSVGQNSFPLAPYECAAAMAMVMFRTEPSAWAFGFTHSFQDLKISKNDRLDTVMKKCQDSNFGSTDCALPMNHALANKIDADTFIVITDNEVNQGRNHPFQALEKYQQKTGIPAKLISVGCTATNMSIADPSSPDMMDVVGFDTSAPNIMTDFSRGDI